MTVPRRPQPWEVAELVRQRTGLRLWQNEYTTGTVIEQRPNRDYACILYGPWYDVVEGVPNRDTRVFVCWRTLEGHTSMQILAQDAVDDAFLNRDAYGAEKFDVGLITV